MMKCVKSATTLVSAVFLVALSQAPAVADLIITHPANVIAQADGGTYFVTQEVTNNTPNDAFLHDFKLEGPHYVQGDFALLPIALGFSNNGCAGLLASEASCTVVTYFTTPVSSNVGGVNFVYFDVNLAFLYDMSGITFSGPDGQYIGKVIDPQNTPPPPPVPEGNTLTLFVSGLLGLGGYLRFRR